MKLNELEKELNVTRKRIVDFLEEQGRGVSYSPFTNIPDDLVLLLRKEFTPSVSEKGKTGSAKSGKSQAEKTEGKKVKSDSAAESQQELGGTFFDKLKAVVGISGTGKSQPSNTTDADTGTEPEKKSELKEILPEVQLITEMQLGEYKERVKVLSEVELRLEIEEKKLLGIKDALEARKKDLDHREMSLFELEALLEKRQSDVNLLEAEAKAGFSRLHEEAREKADALMKETNEKIHEQNEKILKEKAAQFAQISSEIEQYRKDRLVEVENEIVRRRQEVQDETLRDRQSCQEQCQKDRDEVKQQKEALDNAKSAFLKEQEEHLDKIRGIDYERLEIQNQRHTLDDLIEKKLNARKAEIEHDKQELERLLAESRTERDKFRSQLIEMEDIHRSLGFEEDPKAISARLARLEEDNRELREKLAQSPSEEEFDRLKVLAKAYKKLSEELIAAQNELAHLQKEAILHKTDSTKLAHMEELLRAKDVQINQITCELNLVNEKQQRLASLIQNPDEAKARMEVIVEPAFSPDEIKRGTRKNLNEMEWLQQISNSCRESGVVFHDRLLKAFHTTLKISEWSPLSVLAGVSGTGKSELPRLYARFGGLMFRPIAVQPNWDSPQDLFGFFDYAAGRFNATPLLQSLTQSCREKDDNHGVNDGLLLVLLDEMNLAYVELYFSDLLSALERRRGKNGPEIVPIDVGSGFPKYPLHVNKNVLWSGTINEDETTKTLSDKVLDRSNVILFPRPVKLRKRLTVDLAEPAKLLPLAVWDKWVKPSGTLSGHDRILDKYKLALEEMNSSLEKVGKAIGHRVWQSIENFLNNHPDVLAAHEKMASGDEATEELEASLNHAFSDQLVMKVMPKLRGIETSGHARNECLDPIRTVLERVAPELIDDYNLACEAGGRGSFIWGSAKYLGEVDETEA